MKIIKDQKAYTTSILVLILLIPVLFLLIITMEEYDQNVNNTIENLESEQIKNVYDDFEEEILRSTKESLHNITYEVITSKRSITRRDDLISYIQNKINKKADNQSKDFSIKCDILDIKPSDNPFKIELDYQLTVSTEDNKIKKSKNQQKYVEITDKNYPVYDPLPTLKTGAILDGGYVEYGDKLAEYITIDNSETYMNTIEKITIKECPLKDYTQHGNSNDTFLSCLNNHYYHNSHDGMCLLCRLENKTYCNHYGFETFILPTEMIDEAPASIDHVLLNDNQNQYPGNLITVENTSFIYLDNGHKAKYGL